MIRRVPNVFILFIKSVGSSKDVGFAKSKPMASSQLTSVLMFHCEVLKPHLELHTFVDCRYHDVALTAYLKCPRLRHQHIEIGQYHSVFSPSC